LRAIFSATRTFLDVAKSPQAIQMHFVGTSYAADGMGKKTVEPLAAEYGLQSIVSENSDRIPYSMTLRCLLDAHALIVPGSDDPGYTASKIYPYLLARKPMSSVFHRQSSVVDLIRRVGGAVSIPFSSDERTETISQRIVSEWFESGRFQKAVPLDEVAFKPHTAKAQARDFVAFFRRVLGKTGVAK